MATQVENFIHQNTRTSHKRWESMVMYALHYSLRDVKLLSQYKVGPYLIDGYFPDLKLAVEFDEQHHGRQVEEDNIREKIIREELECEFFRICVMAPLYEQIDNLIEKVKRLNPPEWEIVVKERIEGEYSNRKRQELVSANAFEFVDSLKHDLESMGVILNTDYANTPITPSNGEIGFGINFDGITLCLIVTKGLKPKLLITAYAENIPELLSLKLSEWKNPSGNRYKVIENFKGQKPRHKTIEYLKEIRDRLAE